MNKALIPVVLAALTAALYVPRLGTAPIYLFPDEVVVGLEAHSIATTGRDAFHGRFMPLYFEYNRLLVDRQEHRGYRNSWLPPAIFYATAVVLKLRPLSEAAIRLPTAIVGIVSVVLMYFAARRLFGNDMLAGAAAALLALTLAHFIHSRMAADYLYPVPFVLGWLILLLAYLDHRRERALFASALCLGVGFYSYAAATVAMPLFMGLMIVVLLQQTRPVRTYVVAAAGFLLPVALCVPWLIQHPRMIADVMTKYDLNVGGQLTPLQNVRALFTYHRIGDQVSLYWSFFNPRFLFFDGPMELMFSTREVGVFLLPVAALALVGLYAIVRGSLTASALLLVAGLLAAPLAATIVNVNDAIYRALVMLPFVVFLATSGVEYLWFAPLSSPRRAVFITLGLAAVACGALYGAVILARQSRVPGAAVPLVIVGLVSIGLGLFAHRMRLGQVLVIGMLALVPLQFLDFYVDYFADYRRRTALVFSGNIRGAIEEALRQDADVPAPAIYLGEIGSYSAGPVYWKFYLIKHHRQDLLDRTIEAYLFYPDRVRQLPPHSLILNSAGDGATDAIIDRLVAAGELTKTLITEPDGVPTYVVLRRTAAP